MGYIKTVLPSLFTERYQLVRQVLLAKVLLREQIKFTETILSPLEIDHTVHQAGLLVAGHTVNQVGPLPVASRTIHQEEAVALLLEPVVVLVEDKLLKN